MDNENNVGAAPGTLGAVVVPPDVFRLLVAGERICKGDIYCRGVGHSWHESRGYSGKWNADGYWPMARRHNKAVRVAAEPRTLDGLVGASGSSKKS